MATTRRAGRLASRRRARGAKGPDVLPMNRSADLLAMSVVGVERVKLRHVKTGEDLVGAIVHLRDRLDPSGEVAHIFLDVDEVIRLERLLA